MAREFPEGLRSGPFGVARAARLDIPVTRLRRVDLDTPFRGVRVPRELEPSFRLRCRAYAERMPPDHYFSHVTAARLWGIWLPTRANATEVLHVTALRPSRAPRIGGVIGHHIDSDRGESTILDGLAVATPPETLRGLSTLLGLGPLVAACDSLVRRESALMAIDELRSALDGHTGQRGARRLRQAVDLCRPGTDSARETRLRLILHVAGFPEPEVNGVISKAGGRTRFGDLVFRKWWTVVEYEGAHHSEDRTTYTGDIERFEELSEWRFVRVAKEHLVDESSVIRRVDRALRAGGWPG